MRVLPQVHGSRLRSGTYKFLTRWHMEGREPGPDDQFAPCCTSLNGRTPRGRRGVPFGRGWEEVMGVLPQVHAPSLQSTHDGILTGAWRGPHARP